MKRWLVLAFVATGALANAQLSTGFEAGDGYVGSANGTPITGQNGWYIPSVGGVDGNVMTYAGNSAGFVQNPFGGEQFLNSAFANALNARSQHDNNFGSSSTWTIGYDLASNFTGQGASANNISSFSLQDSTKDKYFIALNTWVDPNTHTAWNAQYNVFDSTGAALTNQSPGAAWNSLLVNHWYREWTSFNLATNQVTQLSIEDLTTLKTTTVNPTGWYLAGGANSTLANPTGMRFFGGGAAGNQAGWDNLSTVVPEPGTFAAVGAGFALLVARRRRKA